MTDDMNVNVEEETHEHEEEVYDQPSVDGVQAVTAFLVVIRSEDQRAYADTNTESEVYVQRQATSDDIYRACTEVAKDVVAFQTAQLTVTQMVGISAEIAEQQRMAKAASRLQGKGGYSGPGGMPRGVVLR